MRELPIGVQSFGRLREYDLLYVDKTAPLLKLIKNGCRYFLSRPRRFGKSLTLSTFEAMFEGRVELFRGLAAEGWVEEQSKSPCPVLRIDMSSLRDYSTAEKLNDSLVKCLEDFAFLHDMQIPPEKTGSGALLRLILTLYKKFGSVVVLIDEYDKPILDNLNDLAKAEDMRKVLRSFYGVLKSCDEYLRFVFITGISKFSKMGVFSAMNNLEDISMDEQFGDITGYTQQELEHYFHDRVELFAEKMGTTYEELLKRLRDYYDGFSFDGKTKLYNPFSIMQCLKKREFNNYWYDSGSPSFIVEYMKIHKIQDPGEYRHKVVKSDFASSEEIERADPLSFLFQSGYLTIEKKQEQLLTLDYPNREVLDSISSMYLKLVYKIDSYALLGNEIWKALREGEISEVVRFYNVALAGIPYDDYVKNRNEFWYRSMFVMLLRGAGIIAYSEPHTSKGRADLVIQFKEQITVIEFKFAKITSEVENELVKGEQQIKDRAYAESYNFEGRKVVAAVIVADDEKRQACCKLCLKFVPLG